MNCDYDLFQIYLLFAVAVLEFWLIEYCRQTRYQNSLKHARFLLILENTIYANEIKHYEKTYFNIQHFSRLLVVKQNKQ